MNYELHRTKAQRELIQELKRVLPLYREAFSYLREEAKGAIIQLPATSEHNLPVVHGCNMAMYKVEGVMKDALWALNSINETEWEVMEP